MLTQTDLFTSHSAIHDVEQDVGVEEPAGETSSPIAVPCGFSNRHNMPCRRAGNWPVMVDGKQMTTRGRPMVHCDLACFRGEDRIPATPDRDDDVVWDSEDHGDAS
jgi:hypothetical protein